MALPLSIVVPVFNAAETLEEVYRRITSAFNGDSYEILFVDDASEDASWNVLAVLQARDSRVKAIRLERNVGQHRATLCGLDHAAGDILVTFDDDLQYFPEDIPKLVNTLRNDPQTDVIIGKPERRKLPWARTLLSRSHDLMLNLMTRKPAGLKVTSFKAIRRETALLLLQASQRFVSIGINLMQITGRIRNVSVRHQPRIAGKSGYSRGKIAVMGIDIMVSKEATHLRLGGMGVLSIMAYAGIVRVFRGDGLMPGWGAFSAALLPAAAIFLLLAAGGEWSVRAWRARRRQVPLLIRDKLGF